MRTEYEPKGWVESILDRWFKCRVIINCDREPYLFRWYVLRTKWLGLFIHKFIRSDEDRALHDHPWNFLVIPIWRGYIEHSEVRVPFTDKSWMLRRRRSRVLPILGTRFRKALYRHRVELMREENTMYRCELPAWSIFIRFRKVRDWGFWEPGRFVQWQKWWQDKCE